MKLFTAGKHSEAQRGEKRRVFGKVVRTGPEVFSDAGNSRKIHADARVAGIAARASVDVGLKPHATSNG
ncbi:MAG: hypothetical protein DMG14_07615 [Acidobacteria bacterium]|nr:MAG: hypothetical protein DMG14_07615 [Acidobacteriota bacterium]